MFPREQPIRMQGMKIPMGTAVPEVIQTKMYQIKQNTAALIVRISLILVSIKNLMVFV